MLFGKYIVYSIRKGNKIYFQVAPPHTPYEYITYIHIYLMAFCGREARRGKKYLNQLLRDTYTHTHAIIDGPINKANSMQVEHKDSR